MKIPFSTFSYAGIGSRETPTAICTLMYRIAQIAAAKGWILRSGGAKGADTAFTDGVISTGAHSWLLKVFRPADATHEAIALSARYHPAWDRCGEYARKCHGRNAMIILGRHLNDPVKHVICWTPHESGRGGSGQGIRIAKDFKIPVYDLANPETHRKFLQWVNSYFNLRLE